MVEEREETNIQLKGKMQTAKKLISEALLLERHSGETANLEIDKCNAKSCTRCDMVDFMNMRI